MNNRLTISINLPNPLSFAEGDGDDDIRIPIVKFIDRLNQILAGVPDEFRETAMLKIWGSGDYCSVYLECHYDRPETDDEVKDRAEKNSSRPSLRKRRARRPRA